MAKRKEPIIEEMKSLKPYFIGVNIVFFAVLTVLFFVFGFDYTLFIGGVYGNILCVLNFFFLGKTAQIAVTKSAKSAQTYMNSMYCARYLGLFVLLTVAALVPFINLLAAIVPLLFPKITITVRAFREKDK